MDESVSIIIPTYNNEVSIKNLIPDLFEKFQNYVIEIIVINDGSFDQTEIVLNKLSERYKNLVFIQLEQNCGEQNSVLAGLYYVKNNFVIIMDDDYQHTPDAAMELFIECKTKGADLVYANYRNKKHSQIRNLGSFVFNKIMLFNNSNSDLKYLASFKCFKTILLQSLLEKKDKFFNIDTTLMRITNNISNIPLPHNERKYGKSNYNFSKLFNLFLRSIIYRYEKITAIINFFLISLIIVLIYYISRIIYKNILNVDFPPGYSTVVIFLAFISMMTIIQFIMTLSNMILKNKPIKIKYVIQKR
tara:strand:- start:12231 stop:13139 length:909 start_codon:yes stop_codon:yes gene_type:complete